MRLEVGDIVLGRPGKMSEAKGLKEKAMTGLSHGVVWFETLFGDPAEFSHVGIVSKSGETLATGPAQPYVTEALARVETEPWSSNWEGRSFAIYRYRKMTNHARQVVMRKSAAYTGRPYGWWKLILIAGDAWISRKRGKDTRVLSRLLKRDQEPICSYLVQDIADEAWGDRFGVPQGSAQPDDIGDWCKRQEVPSRDLRLSGFAGYQFVWDTKGAK